MCGRQNDVFPRKFENCVVSTTIKPEQPGQSLRKPQDKSQCRQGGFLTVCISEFYVYNHINVNFMHN